MRVQNPKNGKMMLNLHDTILDKKSIGSDPPQKDLKVDHDLENQDAN